MKNGKGFTLIELIIVIVIVGILAAVAIPKYLDLTSDANTAAVKTLNGALVTGASFVHTKAVMQEVDSGSNTITMNGGTIYIRSGYPRVQNSCDKFTDGLAYWMTLEIDGSICQGGSDAEWYGYVDANTFYFMPSEFSKISENCYVTYVTASEKSSTGSGWVDTDSATITAKTDGC